jgi:hypothetical protein
MTEQASKKIKFDLFSFMDVQAESSSNSRDEGDSLNKEITNYLLEPVENRSLDVLSYWKINQNRFKVLARIVKEIFSVQATSAPIERVFSVSGFLMRSHRSIFTYKNLSNLMFSKCNKQLFD